MDLMLEADTELRTRLVRAIEALILPHDATGAMAEAAQHVVLALLRATEMDDTPAAGDRRLVLEILTPRGDETYETHAMRLKESERRQAGLTLFRLYASMVRERAPGARTAVSCSSTRHVIDSVLRRTHVSVGASHRER